MKIMLAKKLQNAMRARRERGLEREWKLCETALFDTLPEERAVQVIDSKYFRNSQDELDQPKNQDTVVNFTFRNLRLIHSQLSANPPAVTARPATSDVDDRRRADAADRIIRHSMRKYSLQDVIDRVTLGGLVRGTSFLKILWNPHLGEPLDIDDSGRVILEGDIDPTVPSTWDIYPDPDVNTWRDVRWLFERIFVPCDDLDALFPENADLIRSLKQKVSTGEIRSPKYDVVPLYEYHEVGTLGNGYQGKFCYCLEDGTVLGKVGPGKNRFYPSSEKRSKLPKAQLPYHIFTDLDVPDTYWGRSTVLYQAPLQYRLNKLDSITMEAIQAHGVPRLILTEGAEVADDSITNSPWDIVKITGSQPPHFMAPMQLPPVVSHFRDILRTGIDDMGGINESLLGQQSRETSGFAMQYATQQGNMIRHRMFVKQVGLVENCYKTILNIARVEWDIPRTVRVLGVEKAFEAHSISGADIDGGIDIVVEFGTSLSLDPVSRRQEMLTLMPIFEQAGITPKAYLRMMKLNELEGAYDKLDLAVDRQKEAFEEIIRTGQYVAPESYENHKEMMDYCDTYVMTSEFKYLPEDTKSLILRHIEVRAAMTLGSEPGGEAAPAVGAAPAAGAAPLATPSPGPIA
jgi:hypothetical protein